MIEIKELSRHFGAIKAVDKISFTIAPGEIVGFLGPNGAGKTTTMRMMVGYLQPSSGSVLIDGESIFADPIKTSQRIGYLPETNPLYNEQTVYDFLAYVSALRKLNKPMFKERLAYVVENCGLKEVLHQKIGTLSKGYRQRTGLAQAILHDPEVLILDEPTSGLDPNQIIEIRELIRSLGKEKTLILSSHIMQEVQALCDRIVIISGGRIVANDSQESLLTRFSPRQEIRLRFEARDPDLNLLWQEFPELELISEERDNQEVILSLSADAEADLQRALAQFCARMNWLVLEIHSQKSNLEDVFVNLTKSYSTDMASEAPEETPVSAPSESNLLAEAVESTEKEEA
ncbi:MAG TPA: ATP-binding cassette domain-containing protein [Candidatus Cloacimonadota bacterium]|nr:ATP-binding cassette domain-containing protein [Candidatus Cloacimonadota bacterium]